MIIEFSSPYLSDYFAAMQYLVIPDIGAASSFECDRSVLVNFDALSYNKRLLS